MNTMYNGVIIEGPRKGERLIQSISSWSYEDGVAAGLFDSDNKVKINRVTMTFFPLASGDDGKTIYGIWHRVNMQNDDRADWVMRAIENYVAYEKALSWNR